jgi:hypothetical protein
MAKPYSARRRRRSAAAPTGLAAICGLDASHAWNWLWTTTRGAGPLRGRRARRGLGWPKSRSARFARSRQAVATTTGRPRNEEHVDTASGRQRKLVLAAMCLALATVVSAVSSLNVALPDLARDLHATKTQMQWIIDAYAVVFAGLLLLAGALGDRLGRRPVLLAGLATFAVAAAAGLLVDDPGALIAVRALMGLGAAAIMPATLSIITGVFPSGERDRAVSIWAGVAGASALFGLLVSGVLLEGFSWHSVFAFTSVLGVLALVAAAASGRTPSLTAPASTWSVEASQRSRCRASCSGSSRGQSAVGPMP